jgi:hypothetical protein
MVKKNYYRVDIYNKGGMGDLIGFFPTKESAVNKLAFNGYTKKLKKLTEGLEHGQITTFKAASCNMEGWEEGDIIADEYYISK